jgi:hypothetical protein
MLLTRIVMREELIARVVLHSGFAEAEAIAAIASVLAALRGQLGRPEAEALADALPDGFGAPLRAGRYAAVGSLAERIASAERISTGAARERVATVCRALAALLPAPILARVRHALPPDSAELLAPPAPEVPLEAHPHAQRSTLAEARPGSTHPLSESRPRPSQADSVVASDNPHGDTKLSSSRGLTQERENESIAAGRPGAQRPLADADRR